jgi:hypothetical protein
LRAICAAGLARERQVDKRVSSETAAKTLSDALQDYPGSPGKEDIMSTTARAAWHELGPILGLGFFCLLLLFDQLTLSNYRRLSSIDD